jgi:hypothetical protein
MTAAGGWMIAQVGAADRADFATDDPGGGSDVENIDPYQYQGTTHERFIQILVSRRPHEQAKIVRGVIEKYPAGSAPSSQRRPT